jgi:hypothetical protein
MVKVLALLVRGDTTVLAHVVQLDPWHEQAVLLLPPVAVLAVIARDALGERHQMKAKDLPLSLPTRQVPLKEVDVAASHDDS